MTDIGIGGFNVLERCGIIRWGKEYFPQVRVHLLENADQAHLQNGLVLDMEKFSQWCNELCPNMPVLILSERRDLAFENPNVAHLYTRGDAQQLEGNISLWITRLITPATTTMSQRKVRGTFSERELQVMRLLHRGASNDEIAKALSIQVSTVKTYLRRIYERIGAANRAHAVALFKTDLGEVFDVVRN